MSRTRKCQGIGPRPEGSAFRTAASLVHPYRTPLLASAALLVGEAATGIGSALLYKRLFDDGILQGDFPLSAKLLTAQTGLFLAGLALADVRTRLTARAGLELTRKLADRLYGHMLGQPLRYFIETRMAAILQTLRTDVLGLETALTSLLGQCLVSALKLAAAVAVLLVWDPRLALLALAAAPMVALLSTVAARLTRRLSERCVEGSIRLGSHIVQSLSVGGVLLTHGMGRRRAQCERFGALNRTLQEDSYRRRLAPQRLLQAASAASHLGSAVLTLAAVHMISRGSMTVGSMMALLSLAAYIRGPVSQLTDSVRLYGEAGLSLDRIQDLLLRPADAGDRPDAVRSAAARRSIEFDKVSFSYAPGRPVLDGASFTLRAGRLTALVGASGAGKTTAAYLMMRFLDPDSGRVLLDGRDAREFTAEAYRSLFTFVNQDPVLFNISLRENLLFGRPEASESELREACREALILERVEALPEGFDTLVGEGGHRFSGGEKQRLTLARAFLRRPKVLILDEPAAFLDPVSEGRLQRALERLLGAGSTIVLITHRMAMARQADWIVAIGPEGVEQGPHRELAKAGGVYAQLSGGL